MVTPHLQARAIQGVGVGLPREDVVCAKALTGKRGDVIEQQRRKVRRHAHVLALEANQAAASIVDLRKADRVDLPAICHRRKPCACWRVKQQLHQRRRVALVGHADLAARAVDKPIPGQELALACHLGARVIDGAVVIG